MRGSREVIKFLGFGIVCAMLILFLPSGRGADVGLGKPQLLYSDSDFTPADRAIFIQMFSLRVHPDEEGKLTYSFEAFFDSSYGLEPYPELYKFSMRSYEFFLTHERLYNSDSSYRNLIDSVGRLLIDQLHDVDMRTGRTITYPLVLAKGIYHRILKEAGPPPLTNIPVLPNGITPNPFGRSEIPFVYGGDPPANNFPRSVLLFHYCSGTRGITISGGDLDPYVRAHQQLYQQSRKYQMCFDNAVRPFVKEAEILDPFDHTACWDLTTRLRKALIEKEVSKEIEACVRSQERVSVSQNMVSLRP